MSDLDGGSTGVRVVVEHQHPAPGECLDARLGLEVVEITQANPSPCRSALVDDGHQPEEHLLDGGPLCIVELVIDRLRPSGQRPADTADLLVVGKPDQIGSTVAEQFDQGVLK